MKFAYADPPYIGMAKHYAKEAAHRGETSREVNHPLLIGTLVEEYSDGWALSCTSGSLRHLLPLCPPATRVLAWVKPWATFKKNVPLTYAWEPVLFYGGRKRAADDFVYDWHSACRPTGQWRKVPGGVMGAKPMTFCFWLLRCFGFEDGDVLDDLFPGSGVMGEAVEIFTRQMSLFKGAA